MKVTQVNIGINTENAAFDGEKFGREVAQILRDVAAEIEWNGPRENRLYDVNGNTVGSVTLEMEE